MATSGAELYLKLVGEQVKVVETLDKVIKRLEGLEKGTEKAGKKAKTMGEKMSAGFKKMGKAAQDVSKKVVKMGVAIGAAGLVASIYKSIAAASSFETKMREVSTLLGTGAEPKMKKFNKAVRDLAKTTSATANDLASGLYQVISAGTKGTEDAAGAMKLLDQANKMSVAGVSDVFSSVDVLTTSLNAWGASAEEATEFSDQMFKAVELGKLTLNDLSAGLGVVASAAAGAGLSFGEVNAALATMTAAGVPPRRAMTALNAIIRVAAKGSKELDTAFGETASGILQRGGLMGVMEKLQEVTGGDTIALQKLGIEQEAITGLAVLAGTGMDKFRTSLDAMGEATGATELAYTKMSKTFEFQSKKFRNVINEVFISIGEKILPFLIEKMEAISKWVQDNETEIKDFIVSATESIIAFGEFIIENGATIATLFAAIWVSSLGPIGMVVSGIGLVLAGLKKLNDMAGKGKGISDIASMMRAARDVRTFADFEYDQDEELAGPSGAELFGFGKPTKTDKQKKKEKADADAIKKWQKLREAALKVLSKLERGLMDKLTQLRMKHQDELIKIMAMRGLRDEERERALSALRKQHRKSESELIEKLSVKRAVKEAKLMKKWMPFMMAMGGAAKGAAKALPDWMLDAVALGGGRGSVESLARETTYTPGAIGAGQLETLEEKRALAFQLAMEKPGFWDSVATGFAEAIGKKLTDIMFDAGQALLKPFDQIMGLLNMAMSGETVGAVRGAAEQAVQVWEALAENLGPVLDYLVDEGIPMILDAFIEHIPDIIETVMKAIPDIIGVVLEHIPDIVAALIEGLAKGVAGIFKKLWNMLFGKGETELHKKYKAGEITKEEYEKIKHDAGVQAAIETAESLPPPGMGGGIEAYYDEIARRKRAAEDAAARGYHSGGMVDGMLSLANTIRAHSGLFVRPGLAANEVPAILEVGEGVIRKEVVAAMGGAGAINAMNQGIMPGGGDVHLHTEYLYAKDAMEVVDEMQSEMQRRGAGRMQHIIGGENVSGFTPGRK